MTQQGSDAPLGTKNNSADYMREQGLSLVMCLPVPPRPYSHLHLYTRSHPRVFRLESPLLTPWSCARTCGVPIRAAPGGTRRQSARRCVCRTSGRAQRPCGCSVDPPSVRAPVRLPHSRPSATPLRVQRCAPPLTPSLRRAYKVQESGRGRPPRRVCSRPGRSRVRPPVPARVSTCRT